MSSMNFSTSKQYVRPPQRGIFPLDHDADCKPFMEVGLFLLLHRSGGDKARKAVSSAVLTFIPSDCCPKLVN